MNLNRFVCITIACLCLAGGWAREQQYRIWFSDKSGTEHKLDSPGTFLSQQAIDRRERRNIPIDSTDLPVNQSYLKQLTDRKARILATSRWLNTATISLSDANRLSEILALPFVKKYDELGSTQPSKKSKKVSKKLHETDSLVYGNATLQIAMLNGDKLHREGFTGKGISIAVIDGGFLNVDRNPRFNQERIIGSRDFIDGAIDFRNGNNHGSAVLSTMLTNDSSLFIGTAPNASFWLFRSEDTATEYPAEEDYWAAAVEYADSLGIELITTSLGYCEFDNPRYSHTWEELDGKTAFISQAAAMGVGKGLLIVASAGNEGGSSWKKITVPADVEGVLTVGAVTEERKPAYFSGTGFVDGERVKPNVAALGAPAAIVDTEGNLTWGSGTSFATPIIAGLTACLWQALPHLSAQEIIKLIETNSSQALAPDSLTGYGIPDFYAAYRQGSELEETQVCNHPLRIITQEGNLFLRIGTLPVAEKKITLRIHDMSGRIVKEASLSEGSELSLQALENGIYLLVACGESNIWTQKVRKS